MQQPEVRQLAVPLVEIEAVADVELVRHDESDVAHREIVDKPPVRPVEQRHGGDRGGAAEIERAYEVVERKAGVDDVLDDQDVAVPDVEVEVLEHADLLVSAHPRAAVAGELDEVDRVQDRVRFGLLGDDDIDADLLLTPHRLYVHEVRELRAQVDVRALAHVTGGGILGNLSRVLPAGVGARIDWNSWERPPVFAWLAERGVEEDELRRVFNLGIGMCAVVPEAPPGSFVIGELA